MIKKSDISNRGEHHFSTINYWLLVISSLLLFSCTKPSQNTIPANTFTKIIVHDSDLFALSSIQLSDGNYMVFGSDINNDGWMVKLSTSGSILWQKRLPSALNVSTINVIPLQVTGFVLSGTSKPGVDTIYMYQFNNEGNINLSKAIEPYSNTIYTYLPIQTIRLNNGNFAITESVQQGSYIIPFLIILDNSFNILTQETYQPMNTNFEGLSLCELPDGSINISGRLNFNNSTLNPPNAFLLMLNNVYEQKSFTTLTDSTVNETPRCIIATNPLSSNEVVDGIIMVSSKWPENGNGVPVGYYGTSIDYESGSMGIERFDTNGQFNSWIPYTGYSNNGLFNSINPTNDGGYILCGTVNQLNSPFIVSPTHIYVLKVDANLNQQWSNSYDTYYPSYGADACQTTDGGYLISGYHKSFNNHFDMVLIKTDANGNVN